jgi:hypothetical protein
LDREAWLGVHRSLEMMIAIPAMNTWGRRNVSRFSPAFQRYVESELIE